MNEPTRMRYTIATSGRAGGSSVMRSPLARPSSRAPAPPASIWAAATAIMRPRPGAWRRAMMLPSAQPTGAPSSTMVAQRSARRSAPALSSATAAKPMTMPSHSRPLGRSPDIAEKIAIQSGMVATTTAATPDPMWTSATQTQPLPTVKSKRPIGTAARHWRASGSAAPRAARMARSAPPAMRNRMPDRSIGGNPSSPIRTPR